MPETLARNRCWGESLPSPTNVEWRTPEQFSEVEISETGLLRRKDCPDTAYYPVLSSRGYPSFRQNVAGNGYHIYLPKVYRELFNKELPGFETITPDGEKNEFNFKCPYERGIIQTGYGSGKPDAQFSPLDYYHQELPEAVMMPTCK